MSVRETVRAAYRAGVVLSTDSAQLLVSGRGELSPDLRTALRDDKPAIITILTAYGVGQDDGYGEYKGVRAGPKRFATPSGCLASGVCARLGWCERALSGRCCDCTKAERLASDRVEGMEAA